MINRPYDVQNVFRVIAQTAPISEGHYDPDYNPAIANQDLMESPPLELRNNVSSTLNQVASLPSSYRDNPLGEDTVNNPVNFAFTPVVDTSAYDAMSSWYYTKGKNFDVWTTLTDMWEEFAQLMYDVRVATGNENVACPECQTNIYCGSPSACRANLEAHFYKVHPQIFHGITSASQGAAGIVATVSNESTSEIDRLKALIAQLEAQQGTSTLDYTNQIASLKRDLLLLQNLLTQFNGNSNLAYNQYRRYHSDAANVEDLFNAFSMAGSWGWLNKLFATQKTASAYKAVKWGGTYAPKGYNQGSSLPYNLGYYWNRYLGRWLPSKFKSKYSYGYSTSGNKRTRVGDLLGDAEEGYYLPNEGGATSYLKGLTWKQTKGYLKKGSQVLWTAYAAQQLGRSAWNTANAYTGFEKGAYMDSRGATYKRQYWSWKYQRWLPSKY